MGTSRRAGLAERGFSLIEAIVAITILTGVSLAIYAALNTWLTDFSRLEVVERRAEAMRSLVGFVDTLNPLLAPAGEERFGELTVRWRATPVEPVVRAGRGEFSTGFDVGLYEVEATAEQAGLPLAQIRMRAVGFARPGVLNPERAR